MSETNTQGTSAIAILSELSPGVRILNRTREIDYILEMTLDETRRMAKARVANFFLYNAEGQLEPFYQDEDEDEMLRVSLYCIETRSPLNLIKGDLIPRADDGGLSGETATQPVICTNLRTRQGENVGALYLRSPIYYDAFFEADQQLITALGDSFSFLLQSGWNDPVKSSLFFNFRSGLDMLLENSHLNQKVRESDSQLKAVLEVSNLINSSRQLNDMIEAVLYSARRVIRAERASVFLIDEKTGELFFDVVSGNEDEELTGIRIPPGKGIVGKTAQEKRAIMVNDAQNDPQFYGDVDKVSSYQTRNILAAPLLVDGEPIGVVEVLNTIDRSVFSEHDMEIFQSFSDSVAIALQRRKLLDDLQTTNKQLQKKLGEVTSLHSVAAALVEAKTIEELFTMVLQIIFNDMNVGRASILLYNPRHDRLEVVAREGSFEHAPEKDSHDVIHDKLSYHVFITNRPLFTNDLHKSEELKKFTDPNKYSTGSSIIIPLHSARDNRPFGVICLSDPSNGDFTEEEYRLMTTIASQTVRGYENLKLNEEVMARQAFEKEVEITSRIQKNILPENLPSHSFMELGARSVMARTIGGDFYDFHVHGKDGNATMLVADVSGKSLPAALFMALSSSILRTIIRSETDPTRILSMANDLLFEESHSGMFVTVFLARYEPVTGRLRYASAGHNEMLILHENGTYSLLSGKGAPLGVVPGGMQQFIGGETRVTNGDMLVLYTDGVVEAVNAEDEEYGMERFLDVLRKNMKRPAEEIIDRVYEDVVDFSGTELQYDDFTMMVSRFRGIINEARTYIMTLPASAESVPVLRDFLSDLCLRHGVIGQDRDDILISADEAATNIVLHAYDDLDMENPVFQCEIQIEYGKRFRLQFVDDGKFFDLESVENPNVNENLSGKRKGGFGVYLIRSLMTSMEYKRENNKNYFIAEKVLKGEYG